MEPKFSTGKYIALETYCSVNSIGTSLVASQPNEWLHNMKDGLNPLEYNWLDYNMSKSKVK
jgi:hypothetical protein